MLIATENSAFVAQSRDSSRIDYILAHIDATAFSNKVLVVAATPRADTDAAAYEFSHTLLTVARFLLSQVLSPVMCNAHTRAGSCDRVPVSETERKRERERLIIVSASAVNICRESFGSCQWNRDLPPQTYYPPVVSPPEISTTLYNVRPHASTRSRVNTPRKPKVYIRINTINRIFV